MEEGVIYSGRKQITDHLGLQLWGTTSAKWHKATFWIVILDCDGGYTGHIQGKAHQAVH